VPVLKINVLHTMLASFCSFQYRPKLRDGLFFRGDEATACQPLFL